MAKLCVDEVVIVCHAQEDIEPCRIRCLLISGDELGIFEVPSGEVPIGSWLCRAILCEWGEGAPSGPFRLSLTTHDGKAVWSIFHAGQPKQRSDSPKPTDVDV